MLSWTSVPLCPHCLRGEISGNLRKPRKLWAAVTRRRTPHAPLFSGCLARGGRNSTRQGHDPRAQLPEKSES